MMASQSRNSDRSESFFAQDTCALKANPILLGTIERTHSDPETHTPVDLDDFPDGIDHDQLSNSKYKTFVRTGVPPSGTVLVTWSFVYQDGESLGSSLIPCSSLELVDRSILPGDIVKEKATDAQSGVVTHTQIRTQLFPPPRWSESSSGPAGSRNETGDYNVLMGVASHELAKPYIYEEEDVVVYKGWVGRIEDVHREIAIRLPNSTVVRVDENDRGLQLVERSSGIPTVGDPVAAKKGTLRAGRWIFGQYDANQDPEGLIADVQAVDILVRWLKRRYGPEDLPQPEAQISGADLENGSILVYDHQAMPEGSEDPPRGLETAIGDSVRFRDLDWAAKKYSNGMKPMVGIDHVNQIDKIPRSQTLGFDTNVYLVGRTITRCMIQWQDGSLSQHYAIDIVPSQDLDDEDEVWPGEIVFPKDARTTGQTVYTPTKAGVVQAVDAEHRMALVRWMTNATCSFALEEQQEVLLPESRTGLANGEFSSVSLYDIQTLRGFARRIGDIVVLSPPQYDMDTCKDGSITPGLRSALNSATNEGQWMGEVIELGLDGLLKVRLGAATKILDIKVPWECTELAYSSDQDDIMSIGDLTLATDDGEEDESKDVGQKSVWLDEFDQEVIMDDEWESENSEDESNLDSSRNVVDSARILPAQMLSESSQLPMSTDAVSLKQANSDEAHASSIFSYANMFKGGDDASSIEPFVVLEGEPPSDHHWASKVESGTSPPFARIHKEHKVLRSSLPPGVYVRTWESSLHLMRVLMLGPIGTPYEYAPYMFDILLDSSFPQQPPQVFFHSWTFGTGPANPNLYEDGSVCLSLLGTWAGSGKSESWSDKSTVLQVLVSLLGLVLVKEPFYNEAGFEVRSGSADSTIPSAIYSERTFFKTRAFISRAMKDPPGGFASEIQKLYLSGRPEDPRLLLRAIASTMLVIWSNKSGNPIKSFDPKKSDLDWPLDKARMISAGAVIPLKRNVATLLEILEGVDPSVAKKLRMNLEFGPTDSSIKELNDILR